ncbi:hypothetical protein ACFL2C_01955 [Patescibacteria group bacterium]
MQNDKKGFKTIDFVLKDFKSDKDKYISQEFQKYGYELAKELGALDQVSLFIKLSKKEKRSHLQTARSFVKDAENVKSKPALFMWKLGQLKKEKASKKPKTVTNKN